MNSVKMVNTDLINSDVDVLILQRLEKWIHSKTWTYNSRHVYRILYVKDGTNRTCK